MANPFANESTAIRVGPVESVQKSNLSSALALESKRNQIRKELNDSNLTNEEVDRIIYLRENPEMPPSIGPAITYRDAYGRPLSQKQIKQRNKEHQEEVQETVNRNNGLRTFGYSNLSDKQAEQNPELVSQLEKYAAADITAKGLTMAAFIPGMQWLRGVSAPLYYGINAGLTGASAYDWYKNGPNFWNVTGTIGGGFDLLLPTALKGYQNYQLGKALNQGINDIQTVELPYNVGWGPRQTVSVTHKSDQASPLLLYNEQRWDVLNEGANPLGIWFQGKFGIPRSVNTGATPTKAQKALRARQLFSRRPYTHSGDLTLDKPLVTIGDVPNRSALSYQAEQMGADGLIYNNVYDNGYDANQVLLSFRHPDNYMLTARAYKGGPKKSSDSEFVPAYVHQSKESDLARSGKLKDDFYDHTFNVDVGDVANYSEISDYIAPIEKDVEVLNKDLFKDILQQNINEGLLSETSAQRYFDIFNIAKNNIRNFSSLPKEYQDAVIRTIDQNLINRYFISNDGRIWGTFKVGDRWKGVNRKLNDGSSIQYITDARNVPATIAIHEGGHGIQTSIASQSSAIDLKNFVGNDAGKIDFINSLSASELSFFKAQPPSVQNLLYTNQNLFKNIPLREVTNVARDIRAMLTTKGIKTKEQLYKYINEISDDELYSLYPQTNYLRVMKENVQSKKDYVNFLKKLIIGTAFSAPIVIMNNN